MCDPIRDVLILQEMDDLSGILPIDEPVGMTSEAQD